MKSIVKMQDLSNLQQPPLISPNHINEIQNSEECDWGSITQSKNGKQLWNYAGM